jgi:hypothetical protein
MLQFNNNHIFAGYLKQFLSSFNLPTCRIYTAEFEKFYSEHGYEDPRVIESNLPIKISTSKTRSATGITYLKDGCAQQYFWDTSNWDASLDCSQNTITKYWKTNQTLHYNGNKVLGLTKTLKNPTTLYNYQTHEYLGDYLRFLRDFENINLMSMYNCFSNKLCNNIKFNHEWTVTDKKTGNAFIKNITVNTYDTDYKIYMLPVKLFENYTIAIDCYQGVELFCGFYNEKLDISNKAKNLIEKTYQKVPKSLFSQPFIYDKLDVKYWNWRDENSQTEVSSNILSSNVLNIPTTTISTEVIPSKLYNTDKILRSEVAMRESELKLFIKMPATNTSSVVVLEGDYHSHNDSLYTVDEKNGWQYFSNSTVANFETKKTDKNSTLPNLNSREFNPISKLQLLALNTGISYPFADRSLEYLVANVILPNDPTPDNIKRLQKVMEDCGYSFQIDGIWEPKMQMILYDYLMNSGKFTVDYEKDKEGNFIYDDAGKPVYKTKKDRAGKTIYDKTGNPVYLAKNQRTGNLRQKGQKMRSDFYDILGYVDKDAEKLYASWTAETNEKTKKPQVVAKNTLENVDIYSNLYNN